jgi:GntR family transcriptional repressor for pyruvate dehydrogenase complex
MATIKKNKVADLVIEQMQRMIASGQLREGEKLPNQSEFAAQLGVSRTSLREALHTLALLGAIEQRPGYGTVIRSRVPVAYADELTLPMIADEEATIELIVARRLIEMANVRLAVQSATDKDVADMAVAIEEMSSALRGDRVRDFMAKDMEFHYLIAKATHNQIMVHLYLTIQRLIEQFMQETLEVLPGLVTRSQKFHRNIYDAILGGDEDRALESMRQHILDIQAGLELYYDVARSDGNRNQESSP